MTIYFSNTTDGFYDDTISTNIPANAVTVDYATYTTLMEGQADGQVIISDDNGNPILANSAFTAPPIRIITSYAFLARFTPTERGEIVMAAFQALQETPPDPTLSVFLDDLGATTLIFLDDPNTQGAMEALQGIGILTADRVTDLLADGTFSETTAGGAS